MTLAWTFPGGKRTISLTSVVLVNNTAKTIDITVPAGKRWFVLATRMVNMDNVARTGFFTHYKEAAKTNVVKSMSSVSLLASGGRLQWPNNNQTTDLTRTFWLLLLIMDPGETLSFFWDAGGASAGATDADGLIIEYMEMDIA